MADASDQLYGLPLDQFVSERDELARRLRREGRRQDAARVAKLPKPTAAAWGANQALRSQPAAARELCAAGKALAETQSAAVRGSSKPGELRGAIERHRAALERLLVAARGLLDGKGRSLSPATIERVAQTLNALSLDPALAQEAGEARLARERFYTGFDELAATEKVKPARPRRPSSSSSRTGETSCAVAARERRKREATRKRRAAQIKAARTGVSEAKKRTAAAAKARDAAARAARTAANESSRAEERHAKALEAQANAQADLDAVLRDQSVP